MYNIILLLMLRNYCYLLWGFYLKFYWYLKGYLLSSTTISHYLYISLCYLHIVVFYKFYWRVEPLYFTWFIVVFYMLLVWYYKMLCQEWRNKTVKSSLLSPCEGNTSNTGGFLWSAFLRHDVITEWNLLSHKIMQVTWYRLLKKQNCS